MYFQCMFLEFYSKFSAFFFFLHWKPDMFLFTKVNTWPYRVTMLHILQNHDLWPLPLLNCHFVSLPLKLSELQDGSYCFVLQFSFFFSFSFLHSSFALLFIYIFFLFPQHLFSIPFLRTFSSSIVKPHWVTPKGK